MIPTIEIDKVSILAISGRPLEVPARVSDLRPGCGLKWISLVEDGIINLNTDLDVGFITCIFIYSIIFHITFILQKNLINNELFLNSKDETFLSEIVEFSNETLSMNYPLIIPGTTSSWTGLEANAKYKFRLLVECTCSASIECEGPRNVSAFSDIIVETNKPPVPKPIRVLKLIFNNLKPF